MTRRRGHARPKTERDEEVARDLAARAELERRLHRHAEAFGTDELKRRLVARGWCPRATDYFAAHARARRDPTGRGLRIDYPNAPPPPPGVRPVTYLRFSWADEAG